MTPWLAPHFNTLGDRAPRDGVRSVEHVVDAGEALDDLFSSNVLLKK